MIKSTKTWMCGLTLTLGLAACDDPGAAEVELDGDDVTFRGGDGTWGPGKLNTHFLGANETYPLDAIPLFYDEAAKVRLHAVWSLRCVNRLTGVVESGLFYTSDIDGDLGISVAAGELESATFRKYGDPTKTCTVTGSDWKYTVWGVITEDAQGVDHNHYMMILDRRLDANGHRVFKWGVWTGLGSPFLPDYYTPTCAEDVDPVGADVYALRYHAYLVDELAVAADGHFGVAADTFFIACRSGAVGKTIDWGYAPWELGSDVHELATMVARADYCGDGVPHTQVGNEIHIRDEFGVNDFSQLAMIKEAAWDVGARKATCLSVPRDAAYQNGPPIACGGVPLPECTDEMIDDATIATKLSE